MISQQIIVVYEEIFKKHSLEKIAKILNISKYLKINKRTFKITNFKNISAKKVKI